MPREFDQRFHYCQPALLLEVGYQNMLGLCMRKRLLAEKVFEIVIVRLAQRVPDDDERLRFFEVGIHVYRRVMPVGGFQQKNIFGIDSGIVFDSEYDVVVGGFPVYLDDIALAGEAEFADYVSDAFRVVEIDDERIFYGQ